MKKYLDKPELWHTNISNLGRYADEHFNTVPEITTLS